MRLVTKIDIYADKSPLPDHLNSSCLTLYNELREVFDRWDSKFPYFIKNIYYLANDFPELMTYLENDRFTSPRLEDIRELLSSHCLKPAFESDMWKFKIDHTKVGHPHLKRAISLYLDYLKEEPLDFEKGVYIGYVYVRQKFSNYFHGRDLFTHVKNHLSYYPEVEAYLNSNRLKIDITDTFNDPVISYRPSSDVIPDTTITPEPDKRKIWSFLIRKSID